METCKEVLQAFVRIMNGCGNWPDTSTSMNHLADLTCRAEAAINRAEQAYEPISEDKIWKEWQKADRHGTDKVVRFARAIERRAREGK